MNRLILDAGAFVAFERGDTRVRARLAAARRLQLEVTTTSPVVAQVWRNGRRQALLAGLLRAVRVDAPDEAAARRAGELLARSRSNDVVDALLGDLVRRGDTVLTSDPGDVRALLAVSDTRAAVVAI
jgi:hypothetical protein